ncbi:MAG: DNA polymerase I [Thermodesulfobacteriota bacterium]|nr:DNA polymerase I [Thermodesulfobacteriota bacterium]
MGKKEIYLIDGSSYIYRAFYAMRDLSTSRGLPTNATYILARMLLKVLKEKEPEHISFVLDSKGPTIRHEIYKEYKAKRQKMPEALQKQMPYILRLVDALGISMFQKEGYEADDIIATLARRFSDKADIIIISGDKDLMQLVGDHIILWDTLKDKRFDPSGVKEKYGVGPEYIPDLLSLMGDGSDNIPGVPGIGQKSAVTLISKTGHIEDIIKNADQIDSPKIRDTIKENAGNARFGFELVRLDRDIDIEADFNQLSTRQKDTTKLMPLFEELEFKALLKDIAGQGHVLKGLKKEEFEYACDPDIKEGAGIYVLYDTGSAVSTDKGTFVCVDDKAYLAPLTRKKACLCMHDAKDIMVNAKTRGIDTRAQPFDVMLAAYCIDATAGALKLEDLARTYIDEDIPELKDLTGSGRNAKDIKTLLKEETSSFLASHSRVLLPLKVTLSDQMKRLGVENIYTSLELPLIEVLASMEIAGVMVDEAILDEISREITSRIKNLEQGIYAASGKTFNINSPQQLGHILFEDLGLPVIKKTKTGFSTDSGVLEALRFRHELPALLLDYRTLAKLKNTYVDALGPMIDPETSRIHASFNQAVTSTGRISSSEPNLQNIPVRSEEGRRIRTAFVAPQGFKILSADYSQIELRVLAHITKDSALMDSFMHDIDIHARTASEIFNVPIGDVTPDQRRQAKTINFGIIYGMSAHRLSNELGIKIGTAKHYIDNYLGNYPGVKSYMENITKKAKEDGFVTTIMGRRRTIPDINSQNFNVRQAAKRIAINTPIQGSAADIIKMAMVKIHKNLKGLKSRMIIQVHDELIFEVEHSEMEEVKAMVKTEMEQAYPLSVPVKVDVGIGDNWAQAH